MKVTATINYGDQVRSCQVSAELELGNKVSAETLSAQTAEVLKGLQEGFANALSGRPLNNVISEASPRTLPASVPEGNVARASQTVPQREALPGKRKQCPNDPPSPSQRKYLNDLLRLNGLDLVSWCRDKGVAEEQITAGNCQQWIPELRNRHGNTNIPF